MMVSFAQANAVLDAVWGYILAVWGYRYFRLDTKNSMIVLFTFSYLTDHPEAASS